jgi:hypothetical protein
MRELLVALTAFFDEHQRCGELDGGRDNGYIWLRCSCGAQIAHPAGAFPNTGRHSEAADRRRPD